MPSENTGTLHPAANGQDLADSEFSHRPTEQAED